MSVSAFPYGVIGGPAPEAVITLSGESFTAFNIGADATAHFRVAANGNLYKKANEGSWVQFDTTDDWVRPASGAPGPFRVRHTDEVGDAFTSWGVSGTYYALTSNRDMFIVDSTPTAPTKSVTMTWEIDDGADSQDTGTFTMTADRDDF